VRQRQQRCWRWAFEREKPCWRWACCVQGAERGEVVPGRALAAVSQRACVGKTIGAAAHSERGCVERAERAESWVRRAEGALSESEGDIE
jgi:hypothetical protein